MGTNSPRLRCMVYFLMMAGAVAVSERATGSPQRLPSTVPLRGSIEQIGMGSGPDQDESIVLLVPDQQPVRFDVTFPIRKPVPS